MRLPICLTRIIQFVLYEASVAKLIFILKAMYTIISMFSRKIIPGLCFILCLFITTGSDAARTQIFSFDSSLHLPQPAYFRSVKIIDARADTTSIGKYINGFWTDNINTQKPFGEALGDYASQLTALNNPLSQANLLVVLKHLVVVPTNATHISTVFADATFFSGSNGQYKFLFHADSFFESRSGNDEGVWEQQLDQGWYRYFLYAARINPDTISSTTVYTEAAAQKYDPDLHERYPVYRATSYPTGVYFTSEEFLNLKPGLTKFKQWKNRENPDKPFTYYRVNAQGERGEQLNDSEFYAVYDGKNWYKSGPNSLYKMGFDHGDFYFNGKMRGLKAYNPGMTNNVFINLAIRVSSAAEIKKHPEEVNLYRIRLDAIGNRFVPVFRYYTPR